MGIFDLRPKKSGGPAPDRSPAAAFELRPEGGRVRVVLSGAWTTHGLAGAERDLPPALKSFAQDVIFDLSGVSRLDTAGALFLNIRAGGLRLGGRNCEFAGADQAQALLLEKALPEQDASARKKEAHNAFIILCNNIGRVIFDMARLTGELTAFFGSFLHTLVALLRHPGRIRLTSLVFHMEQTGLRAVPIVALLTFLIGLVVAYMGAQQLTMFGAQIFAVNLLEVTVMREMAVLITSIVVAGRSSSSFTAQIGAMVANEEVDALRALGLDPGAMLVVPRVMALILSLPLLVFLADIMALLGGWAALLMVMDMDIVTFITQLEKVARVNNFFAGMIKTPFFAIAIGLVGCFHGFRATGSAESVGFLTTVAVVQSIFIVILLDALFAIFFMNIGL